VCVCLRASFHMLSKLGDQPTSPMVLLDTAREAEHYLAIMSGSLVAGQ